jgi:SH3 domain-containing YSC84-like protein 1
MKKVAIWCALGLITTTSPAPAATLSEGQIKVLRESASVVRELRDASDKGIPEDLLSKARCVLVIPSLKKAAFVVGGEYGTGVLTCRQRNGWSAPVFMQLAKGSWGFQIGAEETDLVLLAMNQRGVEKLLADKVSLGADVSVAAGPVGRSAAAATDAQMSAEMLSYSRSQGLFAGVDVSGGMLRPDQDRNVRAYGSQAHARDIIAGTQGITVPSEARPFLNSLGSDVRATSGEK